jgi:hypothetical protein
MAREVGNLYPTTLTFPINFNQIGLNYKLTVKTFDALDANLGNLQAGCQQASLDNIRSRPVGDPSKKKQELIKGGELHFGPHKYTIYNPLASGSFGTTAIVQNSKDGKYYCLKRQIARDDDDELDCFKEAMMHHILDVETRPDGFTESRSNLIPRLYHVVRSVKEEVYIYFIMDLMSDSLHGILSKKPTYYDKLLEFVRCLAHITPTLRILYNKGKYNHGDLHMGNVMYDVISQGYKIIDYGFSRIEIKDIKGQSRMLVLNENNNRSDESRDLTQLITAFELNNHIDGLQFTQGSFEHIVQQLIKEVVYNMPCSGFKEEDVEEKLKHEPHTHKPVKVDWSSSYTYFNTHTNVNGTHAAIQQAINDIQRSNAKPSYVSHRPAVSSAAPRAGRAASVEIGQINQQNSGVMLLYLMITMISLVFASKIYYGKGGREPIIMNRSLLNHSYQPPSKHATYPAISFPNYSIQMKPLSKSLSNRKNKSKTRSNRTSKKNNTRRRSYKVPQAKIEDFDKLSLVSFYHFLHHAFPKIEDDKIKEMLKEAAMVPIQRADVFSQIVEAVKENDFDHMMVILEDNKLDLSKLGLEIESYQELWNSILDAYFKEKDSPFELLQTLLHVGGNVEDFLKRYHSADIRTLSKGVRICS